MIRYLPNILEVEIRENACISKTYMLLVVCPVDDSRRDKKSWKEWFLKKACVYKQWLVW